MKKLLYFIIAVVVVIGGFLVYATRPVEAPLAEAPAGEAPVEGAQTWSVDPANSSAKFELDEELRGKPFHVVGNASAVSGDVSYDASTGVFSGLVSVDGAALKTDSTQRDGAIARLILHTTDESKRFITFAPRSASNVPPDPTLDTDHTFSVTGVLTANGISKETTWTVTGRASEGGLITGMAKTTVKRGDFGLTIPNIPFVANVSENVDLSIAFTFLKK